MDRKFRELIYFQNIPEDKKYQTDVLADIEDIAKKAFTEQKTEYLLIAHRILYQLNLAHLGVSWESCPKNIAHPLLTASKYTLEKHWELAEKEKYKHILRDLPDTSGFLEWVKQYVQNHHSNELHPIFHFLKEKATYEQMREFFFQESPLEMLFGDILAFMLPGVYGSIKIEYLKNYWDEVGRGRDEYVHRNLRAKLMRRLQIPTDCYIKDYELLICEELELINTYLSLATNRAKHMQLVGAMLATELMIPGRFKYQIAGWKRHGLDTDVLSYLIEHTSVDEVHAEDWSNHVVMPILLNRNDLMVEIVLGVNRRLDVAAAVLDKLYTRIQKMDETNPPQSWMKSDEYANID